MLDDTKPATAVSEATIPDATNPAKALLAAATTTTEQQQQQQQPAVVPFPSLPLPKPTTFETLKLAAHQGALPQPVMAATAPTIAVPHEMHFTPYPQVPQHAVLQQNVNLIPQEVVTVQFHHHQEKFDSAIETAIGEYVVVRGERKHWVDVGRVVAKEPKVEHIPLVKRRGIKAPPLSIVRQATIQEILMFQTELMAWDALALTKVCTEVQRLRLPMLIKACEFQFDRQHLVVYFESPATIPYAPLTKALYKEFNCRVWMEHLDKQVVPQDRMMAPAGA